MDIDVPKADPVGGGCGEREQGGVYAECRLSPYGTPLEYFLIDPPRQLPEGLDIINKPQLWEDPATGITHLLIWIGSEHYQWCRSRWSPYRSEEHTSELQSHLNLVCRLLLEKKKSNVRDITQLTDSAC